MPFEGEGMPVCEVFSPAFTVSWSGLIGRSGDIIVFSTWEMAGGKFILLKILIIGIGNLT